MHACLLRIHDHASLLFYLSCIILDNRSCSYVVMLSKQRPIFRQAYVIHSTVFYYMLIVSRMMFELPADSLFVVICRLDWLYGRKYGTV
jgi:hypothetical protein